MSARADLVERDRELGALDAALAGVAGGSGRVIVVEGPAGIGKSVLLDAARSAAPEQGFRVLSGRGSELEIDFPFGVVRQLFEGEMVDDGSRAVALAGAAASAEAVFDLAGSESNGAGGDVSFSALHGLYWMTLNLAADEPLLLVVDDLHWCDRPSLRFLSYLSHRLEDTNIGVLIGLRTTDPGVDPALVADIAGDRTAVAVRPGAFSAEAVRAVVETRLEQTADERFSAACLGATGGNPLLLGEVLRALVAGGCPPGRRERERDRRSRPARGLPNGADTADAGFHPRRPRSLAPSQFSATGPTSARSRPSPGHEPAHAARITGALARAEILRSGSSLGFAHPLVRSAIYEDIPPAERQVQHARAARLMYDAGASSEKIAAQLLAAPASGEPWAVEKLADAAAKASGSGASDVALTLLTRLLDEPLEPGHRARVLLDLGLAEAKSTNGEAAVGHLRTAYETLEEPGFRAAAAYALARTLLFIGEIQHASDFAAEASKALPSELRDVAQMVEAVELTTLYFGAKVPDVERRFRDLRELPENPTGGESVLAAAASYDWMYRGGTAAECADLASSASGLAAQMEVDTGLTWVVGERRPRGSRAAGGAGRLGAGARPLSPTGVDVRRPHGAALARVHSASPR